MNWIHADVPDTAKRRGGGRAGAGAEGEEEKVRIERQWDNWRRGGREETNMRRGCDGNRRRRRRERGKGGKEHI